MKIEPEQCDAWRKSWSIAIECGPDRTDTHPRDRVFHYERTPSGAISDPRLPRKNSTHARNIRGGMRLTNEQKVFRSRLRRLITVCKLPTCAMPMKLCVWQTYGKRRVIEGVEFSRMDASACLEAVCDAVQADKGFAGLVLDDAQIVDRRSLGIYEKGVWGIRFELEALPEWGA